MIEVENLSKKYGTFEAVKNVSFSVGREQVLGFLGPNGAGKTTIMKILTGYHLPSGGQVKINGVPVEEDPVGIKQKIGYLSERNPLYGDLSCDEYLLFASGARLIPPKERQKAVDAAIAACGLEGHRSHRIEFLSKGYRQRVGLAQAILHDPDILILDEPTSGLDPNQIIEIRNLIRGLGKRKTVILSTHILQEVEAVCSRVLILNDGVIAAQGTAEEIAAGVKGGAGLETWELLLKGARVPCLPDLPGVEIRDVSSEIADNGIVRLCFTLGGKKPGVESGELIFDWALGQGCKIIEMTKKKLSLEDIFVKLTTDESGTK